MDGKVEISVTKDIDTAMMQMEMTGMKRTGVNFPGPEHPPRHSVWCSAEVRSARPSADRKHYLSRLCVSFEGLQHGRQTSALALPLGLQLKLLAERNRIVRLSSI